MTLYHGSNDPDLDELDGNEPGYRGSLGWGLYLTTDPEFAKIFGKHIYEVESPVPDELVAYIEPMTYECGQSMEMYTPGSTPFSFEIVDRKTGETHRYSVLGDCEEEVKQGLRSAAIEKVLRGEIALSDELREEAAAMPSAQRELNAALKAVLNAMFEHPDERVDHTIESAVYDIAEARPDLTEQELKDIESLLEDAAEEVDDLADEETAERLGLEIDLDGISKEVEIHGYSAFFIEGYAPGNEYVIVDEKYLPIPVTR